MKLVDLLLKPNEFIPFFSIAGNREACDRKFDTQLRLDCSCDDGVISEDFLDLIRIGRFALYANSCGSIIRELGATKMEPIGRLAYQN